jgi:hypothetical protein
MAKYYFQQDGEQAYDLQYHLDYMKKHDLKEMVVFEAKTLLINHFIRVTGTEFFFCHEFQEVGEKHQDSCGIVCGGYKPRNGKNGRCIHSGYTYEQTDRKKTLRL